MILIQPKVEVEPFNAIKIMKNIERACRTCYRSEGSITEDSYKKLLNNAINRGHESVLEHEKITVRLTCDIGCYDDKTLVLTTKGWKYFKDITTEDQVFTMTDNGEILISPIRATIKKEYNGELDYYHSQQINLAVTPNHNMWVFDNQRAKKYQKWMFCESQYLNKCNYSFSKKGNKNKIISYKSFKIDSTFRQQGFYLKKYPEIEFKNNEAFYELLGLWVTDGSMDIRSNTSYSLKIHQSKPLIIERLNYLLNELNIKYNKCKNTYNLDNVQLATFIYNHFYNGDHSPKSYRIKIPEFIRNAATNEIEAFLKGVIEGDGSINSHGSIVIYTASEQFAKDLIELYFRIGQSANYYQCPDLQKYGKSFKQTTTTFAIRPVKTDKVWFDNFNHHRNNRDKLKYNGYVYCLMLDNYHKLFVMREGRTCWCGNCYKDLTRHRIASFSIESTRYCNYSKDKFGNQLKFVQPIYFDTEPDKAKIWVNCMNYIENCYDEMAKCGAKPDELRMMLPHSTAAEVTMTANIREWRHILSLRCSSAAHPAVRQLMIPLLIYFKHEMPELFDDIDYDEAFPTNKYAQLFVMRDN